MELLEYWQILRRRWWLPIVLTLLVTAFSLWQIKPWQPVATSVVSSYTTTIRTLVTVLPQNDKADTGYFDRRYFAWLTSEYLVDDFTEVVRSGLFAQHVSQRLKEKGITIPAETIEATGTTNKRHRILTLTLNWQDRTELAEIANAAIAEIQENAPFYFRQLGMEGALVTPLDTPVIDEVRSSVVRRQLEFPLRVGLGFVVGLALVFFLDYLDTSMRNRQDIENLGLTVLGEIPKE